MASDGCLIGYGPDIAELRSRTADFVGLSGCPFIDKRTSSELGGILKRAQIRTHSVRPTYKRRISGKR
jgi:hypothetical protein